MDNKYKIMTKKIKCINNSIWENENHPLIVGKVYEVDFETEEDFFVENEKGIIEHYDKEYFHILKENK